MMEEEVEEEGVALSAAHGSSSSPPPPPPMDVRTPPPRPFSEPPAWCLKEKEENCRAGSSRYSIARETGGVVA